MNGFEFIIWIFGLLIGGILGLAGIMSHNDIKTSKLNNEELKELVAKYEYEINNIGGKKDEV